MECPHATKNTAVTDNVGTTDLTQTLGDDRHCEEDSTVQPPSRRPYRLIMIDLNNYDNEHDSDWSGGNRSEIEYEDGDETDISSEDESWSRSPLHAGYR